MTEEQLGRKFLTDKRNKDYFPPTPRGFGIDSPLDKAGYDDLDKVEAGMTMEQMHGKPAQVAWPRKSPNTLRAIAALCLAQKRGGK